ncbi:chorismate mutase [Burkholderia alba]|uniref:chorismate mutase n=1 Tax=Burkholderia alba TaxID=2683677 RepID=UPI002B05DE75|nr:chorismate mutase [Burkholderia alba]
MSLNHVRQRIDALDDEIIDRLGARLSLVRQVATLKQQSATPVMQPGRVDEVKARCRARGAALALHGEFVDKLYDLIIGEACRIEYEAIRNSD